MLVARPVYHGSRRRSGVAVVLAGGWYDLGMSFMRVTPGLSDWFICIVRAQPGHCEDEGLTVQLGNSLIQKLLAREACK